VSAALGVGVDRHRLHVPGPQRRALVDQDPLDDGAVRDQPAAVTDQRVHAAERVRPVVGAEALAERADAQRVRLREHRRLQLGGVRDRQVGHRAVLTQGASVIIELLPLPTAGSRVSAATIR
jgi:hypothetical protein